MLGYLQRLADKPFIPHVHCYLRTEELVWLHVISDVLIGAAYVAISLTLAYWTDWPTSFWITAFGTFCYLLSGTRLFNRPIRTA